MSMLNIILASFHTLLELDQARQQSDTKLILKHTII